MQNKTRSKLKGKLPQTFHYLIKQENLTDTWQHKNPTVKDYTFHSHRHMTFSRIDMLWESSKIIGLTKKIEIVPKVKSDHNPLIWIGKKGKKQFRWRLNE